MRRLPSILGLVAILLVAAALPASADPQAESFYLECDGVPSGWITANSGGGLWTPGFAVDGTGVYIPYKQVFTATFTPDDGDPFTFGPDVFEKKAPKNQKAHDHGVCTYGGEVHVVDDPDLGTGHLEFVGVAHVFWTGR